MPHPSPLYPGKKRDTTRTGGRVGPSTSLQSGQVRKSRPQQDLIPGLSSHLRVAILTMLSQPTEDEGDEFIDGKELVLTDWICEIIDSAEDALVSY